MSPWEEIPFFQLPFIRLIQLGAGLTAQLFPADPMRVGFIVSCPNSNTNGLFAAPDPNINNSPPPNSEGFPFNTNSGPLMMHQKDWGPIVTLEWWIANSNAAAVTVSLIELKMYKWPQPESEAQTNERIARQFRSLINASRESRDIVTESPTEADYLFSARW